MAREGRADLAPGSHRRLRDHVAGHAYVIPGCRGKTRAGEGERRLERGDLVYSPPGALHGTENASEGATSYDSAATTALDAEAAYDTGRLRERPGEREGGGRAHG